MALFPPILESYQPAVPINEVADYQIRYTIPDIVNANEITGVQVRINYQSNGSSALKTSLGYLTKPKSNNNYVTIVNGTDIDWQPDTYYKVQMRFYSGDADAANEISEWSTIMVIKIISKIEVVIQNSGEQRDLLQHFSNVNMALVENSQSPLFIAKFSTEGDEVVDKYKFVLYDENDQIIEDSGWLQHNYVQNTKVNNTFSSLDQHRFYYGFTYNSNEDEQKFYKVIYTAKTYNLYEISSNPYIFEVNDTSTATPIDTFYFITDSESIKAKENACVYLKIKPKDDLNLLGTYVISRASEKVDRNYGVWEDLFYYNVTQIQNLTANTEYLIYTDYTIESGVGYKYRIWSENSFNIRTKYKNGLKTINEIDDNDSISINRQYFEHSYLYNNGAQLKLEFDLNLSSFKHTTLASKQDTLGSKYPTIVRNGQAYYGEFPLSGLISIKADKENEFLKYKNNSGLYFKNKLVIPKDNLKIVSEIRGKTPSDAEAGLEMNIYYDFGTNDNMVYVERCYREAVEEFLCDGEYKLYKSPTEGNMIIALMDTSLTPKTELHRMIFEFSSQAYEVSECLLENLDNTNIIDIGEPEKISLDDNTSTVLKVGQVAGYLVNDNIIELIKKQEHFSFKVANDSENIYENQLLAIDKIWIEQYPQILLEHKINELKLSLTQEYNIEQETELKHWENIAKQLTQQERYPFITFALDNKDFRVGKNKAIYFDNIDINSSLVLKTPELCMVNYICRVAQQESKEKAVIKAYANMEIWNQIDGLFVDGEAASNEDFLIQYDLDYKDKESYLVNDTNDLETLIDSVKKKKHLATQIYNIYKTIDLYKVIEQDVKNQVERVLFLDANNNLTNHFTLKEEDNEIFWVDNDEKYHLRILNVRECFIEAQTDNQILIDDKIIYIGAGQQYNLHHFNEDINSIKLQDYTHAFVYYRVTIQLQEKGGKNYGQE